MRTCSTAMIGPYPQVRRLGYDRSLVSSLELVHSTIGVKQGFLLCSMLFGLYLDEISHYFVRRGDSCAQLVLTWISILLHAYDIVLSWE